MSFWRRPGHDFSPTGRRTWLHVRRSLTLASVTAALLLLTQAPVNGQYFIHVLPVMLLLGTGGGLAMPALMGLAMSGATPEDSGLASGLVNTTQQVGGAVGLAVLSTFAASRTEIELANGTAKAEALNSGFHLAFGFSAGFVVGRDLGLRCRPAAAGWATSWANAASGWSRWCEQ